MTPATEGWTLRLYHRNSNRLRVSFARGLPPGLLYRHGERSVAWFKKPATRRSEEAFPGQGGIGNHSKCENKRKPDEQARVIIGLEAGGNEVFHRNLLSVSVLKTQRRCAFRMKSDFQFGLNLTKNPPELGILGG